MQAELPASFDCQATAAILRSGANASLASHVAAVISALPLRNGGLPAWIAFGSLFVWCLVVYLGIRLKIDVSFFELLAEHPADNVDQWLSTSSLRRKTAVRTIAQRRQGALRLWRTLTVVVAIQIALILFAIFRMLA
jgi:hypothetical protein